MKQASILVTGGAGYIGSHVVLQLRAHFERVVVLDDLSRGFRQAVVDAPLVVGKVGDRDLVSVLLKEHGVDTVMHFAFGECTVIGSDGDRIRLRQDKDGRVREVALTMLRIETVTAGPSGARHFKLHRKN